LKKVLLDAGIVMFGVVVVVVGELVLLPIITMMRKRATKQKPESFISQTPELEPPN